MTVEHHMGAFFHHKILKPCLQPDPRIMACGMGKDHSSGIMDESSKAGCGLVINLPQFLPAHSLLPGLDGLINRLLVKVGCRSEKLNFGFGFDLPCLHHHIVRIFNLAGVETDPPGKAQFVETQTLVGQSQGSKRFFAS